MANSNNKQNRKNVALANILTTVILCILGGVMLLLNIGLFKNPSKISDSSRMELPLSHSVVDIREDTLKIWAGKSEFIEYKSGAFYPKDQQFDAYKRVVNRNGLADRMEEYHKGFEWECDDEDKDYCFEMPTFRESRVTYVSVPTWIIVELAK